MKKVCVVVTARPSWAKLQPVCEALRARPDVELQIVACASALLERYGRVVDTIRAQGFTVNDEVYSVHEGESLLTSALESGALCTGLAAALSRLRPDCVAVCADRHEVLAAAQAAAYQHIPLVHLQGGERTGSIDDKVRDSITALADYHFVSTERAGLRVYSLTASDYVWNYGCPSIDLAKQALSEPPVTNEELGGDGPALDLNQPFLLVLQHSVTNEADAFGEQMAATLEACARIHLPRVVFWPGQDAGQNLGAKAIRMRKSHHPHEVWRTVRSLPPSRFLRLLTQCEVLVGNSSAGIREASYLGVPVVNIGSRQCGRERAGNVAWAPHVVDAIVAAIQRQRTPGRYLASTLYGSGDAGVRIAEQLAKLGENREERAA